MPRTAFALTILWFGLTSAAFAGQAPQSELYHLAKKVVIGGAGGWDYFEVDSTNTHRVFIPRDPGINVVEADGSLVGTIATPNGSHGLVFARSFGADSQPKWMVH